MPLDYTSAVDEEISVFDSRTGLKIVPSRDFKITPFAKDLLKKFYLKLGETPQEGYARAAFAWSAGKKELAQRLYDAVSKGWFMFSSPVLSNAPLQGEKVRGMPISCFVMTIPDTLEGIMSASTESRWLSVLGGGVGINWSEIRGVSNKSPGATPFLVCFDTDGEAFKQGNVRGGSINHGMDISHPDILEFINMRVPTGDISRKCHSTGFHHSVNISDAFMQAVVEDKKWDLIDPHSKDVRGTFDARDLWETILEIRYRTGEPYLIFLDEANRALPKTQKDLGLRINNFNLCVEISLATNEERTAVCCLSSLNAEKYDEWKDTSLVSDLTEMLDNVLDYFIENAPAQLSKAVFSAMRERSIGIGLMGFHSYLQSKLVAFESEEARKINQEMFSRIHCATINASLRLGKERGEAPDMVGTGRRNAHCIAVAPNANSAVLLDTSPSIEINNANAYNHQTRAGSWLVKNKHLESVLEKKGLNTEAVWHEIIIAKGSVQHLDYLTDHEKKVFKTAIEVDQMWVIDHAADRQKFICQGQSVNLFFPPNADRAYLNKVHLAAWKKNLKSLYYVRTMTPFMVDAISKKKDRVALQDGDLSNLEENKIPKTFITESVLSVENNIIDSDDSSECQSCQG